MPERRTVLVSTPIPQAFLDQVAAEHELVGLPGYARPTPEQYQELLPGADGVLTSASVGVPGDLLQHCPRLKVISITGSGFDKVDVERATGLGIAVCNAPGVTDRSVADLAIAMMLILARKVRENEELIRSGGWKGPGDRVMGTDLRGKTLGLIGLGGIARVVARTAKAFEISCVYYQPRRDREAEAAGIAEYRERDDLLRESDFVSLHMRLDETTRGSFGARELALMKPTAYLVNTARGEVVDEPALIEALTAHRIAGAGLDVMQQEPLPAGHALTRLANLVLLPHLGSITSETRDGIYALSVANLLAVLAGRSPAAIVNPEVLAGSR
jgi:glyoxylate reductase